MLTQINYPTETTTPLSGFRFWDDPEDREEDRYWEEAVEDYPTNEERNFDER